MVYLHQTNLHQEEENPPTSYFLIYYITFISFAVFKTNSKDSKESLPIIGSDSLAGYSRDKYHTCIPNDYLLLKEYEKQSFPHKT